VNRRRILAILATIVGGAVGNRLCAQEPAGTSDGDANGERKALLEECLKDAQAYEITLGTTEPDKLELWPQSVMNWNGSAFVWLREGRPEVIGTFWRSTDARTKLSRWQHAFHSLSELPIAARFEGPLIWNPKTPGLEFRPVEGAEAPADKSWRRLAQMRALARDFSVVGIYPRYESPRRTLRLLTHPIFRYEPTSGVAQDGAIFVYSADVVVTDPDALLVLEARQAEGKLRWEYAFARFHYIELTGYHRDTQVWKVESESLLARQHVFGAGPDRENVYYSVPRP
jgi:hypothetical protein